jgi:hypothetical protein
LHQFGLFLTGTGSDAGPYWDAEGVRVVPESLDQSWWSWKSPAQLSKFEWKNQDYGLIGNFVNRSSNVSKIAKTVLTGNIIIEETEWTGSGANQPVSVLPSPLAINVTQGDDLDVPAGIKAKTWKWTEPPGTYLIVGDLQRLYVYVAHLSNIRDQYGNIYSDQDYQGLSVYVFVTDQKITASKTAVTALAIWAAESAVAIAAAGVCGAICAAFPSALATASMAVYGIAAKIADDPPTEDALYRRRVDSPTPGLPPLLTSDSRLRHVGQVFQLTMRILTTVDALNITANRLAISRRERNAVAVTLHVSAYRQLHSELSRDSEGVETALEHALPFVLPVGDALPKQLDPELLTCELSEEARNFLAEAWRAPLTASTLLGFDENLRAMVASARLLATFIEPDPAKLLGP